MNSYASPHHFSGVWITHPLFSGRKPLNVFHRENEPLDYSHPEHLKNIHLLFSRTFSLTLRPGCRYRMDFSADDYARIRINGRTAALGPAQGYWFHYRWNQADITDLLQDGENTIEAQVYYQGLISRSYQSGDLRCGLILDLYEEMPEPSGTHASKNQASDRLLLKTDSSFLTTRLLSFTEVPEDRIMGYDTQYPENFDSRKQPAAADFVACTEHPEADYLFSPDPAPSIVFYEKKPVHTESAFLTCESLSSRGTPEMLPDLLTEFSGKERFRILFFDFGKELTASLKLRADGKRGQKLSILCGEELCGAPWNVRFDMRCGCRYEETWILDEGENLLEQLEYKGFRYVSLLCPPDVTILDCSAEVRHYPFEEKACILRTDDPVLAQVFELCRHTVQCGCQETYVDCPTREKGQYLGDLTITSASHLWLTGDGRLLRKALEDFCLSLRVCPGMLAVAPGSLMQEIADYSLQFPIVALRYYEFSKDRKFLAVCLDACREILSWFRQFEREDGLLEQVAGKWNLVDWPENLRDGYDFPLTRPLVGPGIHNVINAFYLGFRLQVYEMQKLLGYASEKEKTELDRLTESFQNAFLDRNLGLYMDTEGDGPRHASIHSNILPVFYGFHDPSCRDSLASYLSGRGICSGVYMIWFQMKALCRLGQYRTVWDMITSTGENSWYHMIQEGGTCCFEAWGKDQKWNTSLCHPWATGPISVLIEDLLGYRLDGTRKESHLPDGITAEIQLPASFRKTQVENRL